MKLKYIILSLLLVFSCTSKCDVAETESLLKNNFEIIASTYGSLGAVNVFTYKFIIKADSIDFFSTKKENIAK